MRPGGKNTAPPSLQEARRQAPPPGAAGRQSRAVLRDEPPDAAIIVVGAPPPGQPAHVSRQDRLRPDSGRTASPNRVRRAAASIPPPRGAGARSHPRDAQSAVLVDRSRPQHRRIRAGRPFLYSARTDECEPLLGVFLCACATSQSSSRRCWRQSSRRGRMPPWRLRMRRPHRVRSGRASPARPLPAPRTTRASSPIAPSCSMASRRSPEAARSTGTRARRSRSGTASRWAARRAARRDACGSWSCRHAVSRATSRPSWVHWRGCGTSGWTRIS